MKKFQTIVFAAFAVCAAVARGAGVVPDSFALAGLLQQEPLVSFVKRQGAAPTQIKFDDMRTALYMSPSASIPQINAEDWNGGQLRIPGIELCFYEEREIWTKGSNYDLSMLKHPSACYGIVLSCDTHPDWFAVAWTTDVAEANRIFVEVRSYGGHEWYSRRKQMELKPAPKPAYELVPSRNYDADGDGDEDLPIVPEPASAALLASGFAMFALRGRRGNSK